jgi:hypothetical protein
MASNIENNRRAAMVSAVVVSLISFLMGLGWLADSLGVGVDETVYP